MKIDIFIYLLHHHIKIGIVMCIYSITISRSRSTFDYVTSKRSTNINGPRIEFGIFVCCALVDQCFRVIVYFPTV